MRTLINLFLLSLLLLSCGKRTPKIDYEFQQTGDTLKMNNLLNDTSKTLVAGLPVLFDSIDFLIHPVGFINKNDRESRGLIKSGSFSGSSYSASEFDISGFRDDYFSGNMTNLVFENFKSGEQRLLTHKVIDILSFQYLRDIYKKVKRQYILYSIIDQDTNHDKELDYKDIESLYISNIDGSGFKKLTRDRQNYDSGELIPEVFKYYFKTIEDINHDGEFDKHDTYHYFYLDFSGNPVKVIEYNPLKLINK